MARFAIGRDVTLHVDLSDLDLEFHLQIREGELGGALTTLAIHANDLLTHVLGPVRSVFARTATRVNAIETEKYDPSLPLAFRIARTFARTIEEIFEEDGGD